MKNLKSNNGITLVTLAITIIVMLILAGIVIGTLTGDEGFITKSKEIKQNIEQSELEGQQRINTLKDEQAYDDKLGTVILNDANAPTINSMEVTKLTQNSMKVSVNITETGSGLAKIEYSIDDGQHYITPENNQARTYVFEDLKLGFEEYKIKVKVTDVSNNSSYASRTIEKFKIGDYVNYTYDTAENYILTSDTCGSSDNPADGIPQTTGLKWRILNIDESTGKIDLVSATPTSTDVYFYGAKGYNNGVYLLNDMCAKQYGNSSLGITARSINLEDTEKHLTEAGLAARNAYAYTNGSFSIKYGNTKTHTSNRKYPLLWARQNGSGLDLDLTELDINATDYQDKVRAKLKKDGISESDSYYSEPTTETLATAGTGITVQQTGYEVAFNSTNYGDAGAVLNSGNWYWFASRYAHCYPTSGSFGLLYAKTWMTYGYLFLSLGTEGSHNNRVRPVVSLEPNLLDVTRDNTENRAWNVKTSR